MNKSEKILAYHMITSKKITRKWDRFWLYWKYSKCQNGSKAMYHLTKLERESMISLNGILKSRLKSKISPRDVSTLMEAKLPLDLHMSFNRNLKPIRPNFHCWWWKKWVKPNKAFKSLLKFLTFPSNNRLCWDNMVNISKAITTFWRKIRAWKIRKLKLKTCKVN